jgi:carbon storage regulator
MLVLSRKTDQRIRIGDDIEIVVLGIDGDHVKIGIKAPRQVPVLRFELLLEVQDENRRAASAAASEAALGSVLQGIQGIVQFGKQPAPSAAPAP